MNREKKYFSFSFFVLMLITFFNITKVHAQLTLSGPTTAHYGDIFTYTLSENSGSEFWDFSWGADGTVLTDQSGHETEVEVYWDGNPGSNHLVYVFYKSNYYWNESYYEELSVNVASDPSVPEVPSISSLSCDEVVLQRSAPPGNSRVNNEDITWFWQSTPTGTSTANSNPTITLTSGTEYFLRARTNSGNQTWSTSSSSMQYQFKSGPPTVGNIVQPTVTTATGSVTLTGLPSDYWVINPGNITGSGTTKTITGLAAATTYNFTVTNSSGCASNPSANVVINAQSLVIPTPVIGAITQPGCTTATGSFLITNYDASYTYTANPSTGISFSGAVVTALPGNYAIKAAIGANSSPSSANITVNLQPTDCPLSNENYVHTISPLIATSNIGSLVDAQKQEAVTYFDGLGRPMQAIGIRGGGNNEDIITHITHDDFGRQDKEYLPYAEASNKGLFRTGNIDLATKNFYNTTKYENTTNPYSQKEFESSPLNRVLKQAAPGTDWSLGNGHEIKLDYQSNQNNEVKNFRVSLVFSDNTYTPTLTQSSVNNGFYNANELYKTVTYDENTAATPSETSGSTVEFKNKEGQVILKRTYGTVGNGTVNKKHDTYYVYDNYGNLTYVIPPKALDLINTESVTVPSDTTSVAVVSSGNTLALKATQSIKLLPGFHTQLGSIFSATIVSGNDSTLNELCYQYKYDQRNRLVEKKLPGKQWEFIVYDKLDRVVATGPALSPFNDSAANAVGWMITKYDVFDRPVYTGWEQSATVNSNDRIAKQNALNSITIFNESKQASGTIDNITAYYTNTVIPTSFKLLTVNYYDNYTFPGTPAIPTTVENQTVLSTQEVNGLSTGSWIRIPTAAAATQAETTATFYDKKARPIRVYKSNFLQGYTYTDSKLDFTGKPEYIFTYHKRDNINSTELKTKEVFTYSEQGRLLTQTHQINDGSQELIVSNTYDELGQLTSKKVGNNIQNINFAYNIRGWLKDINNVNALNQGSDPKDLFAFKINYNTSSSGISGVNALYNGNIAETQWATNSDNGTIRTYGYIYDNLNRLKDGIYKKDAVVNTYNESMNYDMNGNIMHLARYGSLNDNTQTLLDDLTYDYTNNNTSNQLGKVTDAVANNSAFVSEFKDSPFNVDDDFAYDANGNMTRDNNKNIIEIKYNHLNLPTTITFASTGNIVYIYNAAGQKVQKIVNQTGAPSVITDYLGGYQYNNAILKFFPTAEGYVEPSGSSYKYVYQYKDHLGNVRVSYDKDLVIQEENNYYPFGLKQEGYNTAKNSTNDALKFKYNGKELQDELGLGMYDFGARMYMPDLGRFLVIDPMADFINYQSPYVISDNNPVLNVDEYGLGIFNVIGNLFSRLVGAIGSIGNDCSCNTRTQESVGEAWRRADFPELNEKINDLFSGSGKSTPPPVVGINLDPIGITMGGNGVIVPPEINIPKSRSLSSSIIDDDIRKKGATSNISVLFESNSQNLKNDAPSRAMNDKTLNDLLKTLKEYPEVMLLIQGNVSNKNNPTWKENTNIRIDDGTGTVGQLQLSRAKAIKRFLVKRGIDPDRLSVGKGVISKGAKSATIQSQ